jgi:hypothetical protein
LRKGENGKDIRKKRIMGKGLECKIISERALERKGIWEWDYREREFLKDIKLKEEREKREKGNMGKV